MNSYTAVPLKGLLIRAKYTVNLEGSVCFQKYNFDRNPEILKSASRLYSSPNCIYSFNNIIITILSVLASSQITTCHAIFFVNLVCCAVALTVNAYCWWRSRMPGPGNCPVLCFSWRMSRRSLSGCRWSCYWKTPTRQLSITLAWGQRDG